MLVVLVLALPLILFFILPSLLSGGPEASPEPTSWSSSPASSDDWVYPTTSSTRTGSSSAASPGSSSGRTSVARRSCTPSTAGAYGRVAVEDDTPCELGLAVREVYVAATDQQRSGPLIVWEALRRRPLVFTCSGTQPVRCSAEGGSVVQLSAATAYLKS